MIRNSDPEYTTFKGERYYIDTDFRTALKCIRLAEDRNVSDIEKVLGTIYMLFDCMPEDEEIIAYLYQKAGEYLRCGETQEENLSRKKDMDFEQDYGFIEASFQSDYGIDLSTAKMSWWRFMRLLCGLTDKCILSRVREIRNYDLSTIKDAKFRNQMIKAKEELALIEEPYYTDEELEKIERFNSL